MGVSPPSGGRCWPVLPVEPRSAGLQTGIAAAGRETPVAMFAHSRDPLRGQRNAAQPRSAGLQTGIAAAGRETPVAMFAHSRDPLRGRRNAGLQAPTGRTGQHRGRRPRNSRRYVRPQPGPPTRTAQRRSAQERRSSGPHRENWPASRPQAAKLPSLRSPIAVQPRSAGLQAPTGRTGQHRGRRPRNSRRYVRPQPGPPTRTAKRPLGSYLSNDTNFVPDKRHLLCHPRRGLSWRREGLSAAAGGRW